MFVGKLYFATTWIRFNITFQVLKLALFCASAGSEQWSALHHLMECLEGSPSLQLIYSPCKGASSNLLSGYADSDWGNTSSSRSTSCNMMHTTSLISCGALSCRRLWLSLWQRQSTWLQQQEWCWSMARQAVDALYASHLAGDLLVR
jgi:hypothetical protein